MERLLIVIIIKIRGVGVGGEKLKCSSAKVVAVVGRDTWKNTGHRLLLELDTKGKQ